MNGRKPRQVAASVRIALAMRDALAEAMDHHVSDPWDPEVLGCEVARLLGMYLRGEGASPGQLDDVVQLLRQVYAGLVPGDALSVVDAIEHYCGAELVGQTTLPLDESGDGAIH